VAMDFFLVITTTIVVAAAFGVYLFATKDDE